MRITGIAVVLVLTAMASQPAANAWAQAKKPLTLSELAAYTGADREQRLYEGAKSEGKVVWYTSLAGSSYKDLVKGFESKYPGIKVETYRGTSTDIMTRLTAEAQAKQILADVLETTMPPLTYLKENKLLLPYTSPYLGKYPASTKESAGRGLIYWAVDRETYSGVGINTSIIPPNLVPRKYDDLLRPELKGKIGFVSNETGVRAIGGMLKAKGEGFVKKLKAQDVVLQSVSGRAMADLSFPVRFRFRLQSSAITLRRLKARAPRSNGCPWIWCRRTPAESPSLLRPHGRTEPCSWRTFFSARKARKSSATWSTAARSSR